MNWFLRWFPWIGLVFFSVVLVMMIGDYINIVQFLKGLQR